MVKSRANTITESISSKNEIPLQVTFYPYSLLFPEATQATSLQTLSDPALTCSSDEVSIHLPAKISQSLKTSKLDSSSQPTMSNQTQPHTALSPPPGSKWHLAPSHPRRCVEPYTPRAGFENAQYLVPATAPSFFPRGSSSSTPHHSPLAKSVSPT